MYRYGRGIRYVSYCGSSSSSSSSSSSKRTNTQWDPTISLQLNHPSLVLLEKVSSRAHFKQILGHTMRSNLIEQTFPMSRLIFFSAVSHPENLDMAIKLFNHYTPNRNLYIYNTMISALSHSSGAESFCLYNSLLRFGIYPDNHTILYLLQAAGFASAVQQIQGHAIVTGLLSYGYLQNSLLKMYLEHGLMRIANQVFERMPDPDVVSFNIIIAGYAKKGYGLEALQLFNRMVGLGLEPDEFTVLGLLVSCGQLGALKFGKAAHAWMERRKSTVSSNLILCNSLLDMYVKCQALELALRAFDTVAVKDVVSWNTMIAGCAKAGELELARSFFDQMPCRDIVSWNSLIAGYSSMGNFTAVKQCLHRMLAANVMPDNNTMVCVISGAADIGALSALPPTLCVEIPSEKSALPTAADGEILNPAHGRWTKEGQAEHVESSDDSEILQETAATMLETFTNSVASFPLPVMFFRA
ncbi:hypothetical protein Tsubulata_037165 [Turnera subulata]|uniref:Pentacotripeptide-repeat region of PRORP domain-containing protein n=1 Tax=Turnera subulata TaxID=218843 RepID=A0A9Q0JPG9_9ROSI|nr:hypothetical protein Tsubulata_037165 [Turnera subulata]